jgi:uracil phosphoribosyltransferase
MDIRQRTQEIPGIAALLTEFSAPNCNPLDAQRLAADMGERAGEHLVRNGVGIDTLCPILRAGLPFAVGISRHYPGAHVAAIHARRLGGRDRVAIERMGPLRDGATILLIDTIGATGSTLVAVSGAIREDYPRMRILAISAYASPTAVERVLACGTVDDYIVGRLADGVDADGYLYPPTHGDAGDKLYADMF